MHSVGEQLLRRRGRNEAVEFAFVDLDKAGDLSLAGEQRDLTPGEKTKARFVGWSGDDRSMWIATNERDARYFDLYRYAIASFHTA